MVALPYKAAEAEGGQGRVGGEKSQHPAVGAGWGGAGAPAVAGLDAWEQLGKPAPSCGPLPANDVRPPEWAGPKEYGWIHGPNLLEAGLQEAQDTKRIPYKPWTSQGEPKGPGPHPHLMAQSGCKAEND